MQKKIVKVNNILIKYRNYKNVCYQKMSRSSFKNGEAVISVLNNVECGNKW